MNFVFEGAWHEGGCREEGLRVDQIFFKSREARELILKCTRWIYVNIIIYIIKYYILNIIIVFCNISITTNNLMQHFFWWEYNNVW